VYQKESGEIVNFVRPTTKFSPHSRAQVGAIVNNTAFLTKQPDGKLIVGSYSAAGAVNSGSVTTNFDYVFLRVLASGDLDDTFGFDGRIIIPISNTNFASGQSSTDVLSAIGIQPDGKIVGTGRSFGSDFVYHFASIRLDRTGMLDTSFGSAGRIDYGFNGLNSVAKTLLFQSDGKIVTAGYVNSGTKLDFAVQRISP